MTTTTIDYRRGPRLDPAGLLELYREREPGQPLLLRAVEAAQTTAPPGPELPWLFKNRRDTVYDLIYQGRGDRAETLAASWIERAQAPTDGPAALELIAGIEAYSLVCEFRGDASDAASALAAALRLHRRRDFLPYHGVLLRRCVGILATLGGIDAGRLLASEALRLAIETNDRAGAAFSLAAAQRMAAMAHDWAASLSSAAAARQYLPQNENLLRFSIAQSEVTALSQLHRFTEAETALAAAEAAVTSVKAPLTESFLWWSRARLRQNEGRHEEAAAAFVQAEKMGWGSQEPLNRVLMLLDFAPTLESLGREKELRERCARLDRELPEMGRYEGPRAIAEAFAALCKKWNVACLKRGK